MTVACRRFMSVSMALACLFLLVLALFPGGVAEAPPPCEPPAGYIPPEVDVRIVGLMMDQLVGLGTTHELQAEALDEDGSRWGERYDWYVDGVHVAKGDRFSWTVTTPEGDQRVTLVVTDAEGVSAWVHVDVRVDSVTTEPPSWLGPVMRTVPLMAMVVWLALTYRHFAQRRDRSKGSG
jgi:hypothetical protein